MDLGINDCDPFRFNLSANTIEYEDSAIVTQQSGDYFEITPKAYISYSPVDDAMVLIYSCLDVLLLCVGCGAIIFSIMRNPDFHTPHFYLMLSYMVGDILQVCCTLIPASVMIVTNSHIPQWLCKTIGLLPHICLFQGVHSVGTISFERYMYLCKPLKYTNVFTQAKTCLIILGVWGLNTFFAVLIEVVNPREFNKVAFICLTELPALYTALHWSLIALPPFIITVFSTYKVFALRRSASVAPAEVSNQENRNNSPQASGRIGKSLRMILFTSGLLWLMVIPSYAVISVILRSGVTWGQMENGSRLFEGRLNRCMFLCMYTLVPGLNVIVHFYTHPELRRYALSRISSIFPWSFSED